MSLDWPTLQALIDAGDTTGVATAVRDLDDRQRRGLASPLQEYARQWKAGRFSGSWQLIDGVYQPVSPETNLRWRAQGQRSAALRAAVGGALPGTAAVAGNLARPELWDGDPRPERTTEVLRARPASWLAELAHRMASQLRAADTHLFSLVVELALATGVEPPTTGSFVAAWHGWTYARCPQPHQAPLAGATLAEVLRRDPFLPTMAPMLFRVDGVSRYFEASWSALAILAAEGTVDRTTLLDGFVGRWLSGGPASDLGRYVRAYETFEVTVDELTVRVRDLVRLLPDAHPAVARLAQRELRRVDDAGQLPFDNLLEASRAVLFRPEKSIVTTQLSWLDAAARRRTGGFSDLLVAASVAFGHPDSGVQQRALSLVLKHAPRAGATARAELLAAGAGLPADLRDRLGAAFGETPPSAPRPTPPPVLAPPAPRELPPPIGSMAELAEESAALLQRIHRPEPVELERVLAALVSLAHADRTALGDALRPVLARHGIEAGHPGDGSDGIRGVFAAAIAPPTAHVATPAAAWSGTGTPGGHRSAWPANAGTLPGPGQVIMRRLQEIAAGLAYRPVPSLVSTPTTSAGHIDPEELVARLQCAAKGGWQPGECDLQQALLRLPRAADPMLASRARSIGTPAGERLATHLTNGGFSEPTTSRTGHAGAPEHLGGREYSTIDTTRLAFAAVAWQAPDGIPGNTLAQTLFNLTRPQFWYLGWAWPLCWPAVAPSHRDIVAAHLLSGLVRSTCEKQDLPPVLPPLAETDGPVGVASNLALAYGLSAIDATERAAAVEAVLIFTGRGQLDGAALGTEIGGLATAGVLKLNRIASALRDVAAAGAHPQAWAIIGAALPQLLGNKPPNRLADLLTLGVEVADKTNASGTLPELSAYAARSGSSHAVTEARRLHHLLTAAPA